MQERLVCAQITRLNHPCTEQRLIGVGCKTAEPIEMPFRGGLKEQCISWLRTLAQSGEYD